MERVAGPVDDRLEQLVPRPRGRREPGDLVQEAELLELVGGRSAAARRPARRGAGVARGRGERRGARGSSRPSRYKPTEGRGPRKVAAGSRLGRGTGDGGRWPRVTPVRDVAGGRRRSRAGSGRPAPATRSRSRSGCSARCSARSSRSRPGRSCSTLVERIRRRTIALRRDDDPLERAPPRRGAARRSTSDRAEAVIGAFALYFGLVNLAEARGRVRALRRRERAARDGVLDDSVADAVGRLRRLGRTRRRARRAHRPACRSAPVLTAHPTEARRRTVARRAAPLRRAARAARRPAPDAVARTARCAAGCARRSRCCGGRRDLRLVAPGAARRGPDRDGVLRRDAVHRRARGCTARSTRRSTGRPAAAARRRPPTPAGPGRGRRASAPFLHLGQLDRRRPRRQPGRHRRDHRADPAHPGRPRPPRLRGGRHPADADDRRGRRPRTGSRARSRRASLATPRTCPRPTASSAGASPTSRTASGSGSSPSGCAGPEPRSPASRRR